MAVKKEKVKKEIVGFTKPQKFLFFRTKPKPIYKEVAGQAAAVSVQTQGSALGGGEIYEAVRPKTKPSGLNSYLLKSIAGHRGLDIQMKELGIRDSIAFARRAFKLALAASAGIAIAGLVILLYFGLSAAVSVLLSFVISLAVYMTSFNSMLMSPYQKTKNLGNEVEKDVLFAARDMIISMRSGMPLFNAIATVSEGYGAASAEFAKIIKLVQVGTPIEVAIDEVSAKSGSKTFQRLMLQASTSIKVGADVVNSLQEVINDVSQERVIELRRYGQRLNAIAMFYMLFGVIFPSMGIAVGATMSTFINIITINDTTLIIAVIVLCLLQFVFLKMITGSRPPFSM